jgi:VWFA-related protein
MVRRSSVALLAAIALLTAALLLSPANLRSFQQPQQQPPQQPPGEMPVFKDTAELVNVLATVHDKKGRIISTLEKQDFQIFEDGKPQEIKYFNKEVDLPLTIGLLFDCSGSETRMIPMERDGAISFFNTVLRQKDMAFLITFATDVDLVADFTNDKRRLQDELDKIKVITGGPVGPGMGGPFPSTRVGGTHLFDALYLASHDLLSHEVGRKTVILLTDGEDEGSKLKVDQAIEAAQKADVVVYGVHYIDRGFGGGFGRINMGGGYGEGVLKKMTEETGGRYISPNRDNNLRAAFQEIADELRSQYSIGYAPTNSKRDGSFRKIEIRVNQPDLKVQTRKGYFATANNDR